MASEGLGFLEIAQFGVMVGFLIIAVRLLSDPFVRRRPLVFAATVLAALSCFYIAGEEVNWGQHIVYFDPLALFLPAAALVPAAIGALLFKVIDVSSAGLVALPSESIEFYLYFFILAYPIVFERRITALKTAERGRRQGRC